MQRMESPSGQVYYTDNRPEINCFQVYGDNYKQFLKEFIPYLESTDNDAWIDVIFANADTSKRCVIWHFIGFVGQDNPESKSSQNLDWYDANVCFIQRAGCEVNDGNHPDYQQPTPKERSIAYLKNLLEGKELTPMQLMDQRFGVGSQSNTGYESKMNNQKDTAVFVELLLGRKLNYIESLFIQSYENRKKLEIPNPIADYPYIVATTNPAKIDNPIQYMDLSLILSLWNLLNFDNSSVIVLTDNFEEFSLKFRQGMQKLLTNLDNTEYSELIKQIKVTPGRISICAVRDIVILDSNKVKVENLAGNMTENLLVICAHREAYSPLMKNIVAAMMHSTNHFLIEFLLHDYIDHLSHDQSVELKKMLLNADKSKEHAEQ